MGLRRTALKRYFLIGTIAIITVSTILIIAFNTAKRKSVALDIPSLQSIEQHGFPVNQSGETYGPQPKDMLVTPDLILVTNSDGLQGYVKKVELDYTPSTKEEAGNITEDNREILYDMYLQDGETIIGTYKVQSPSIVKLDN